MTKTCAACALPMQAGIAERADVHPWCAVESRDELAAESLHAALDRHGLRKGPRASMNRHTLRPVASDDDLGAFTVAEAWAVVRWLDERGTPSDRAHAAARRRDLDRRQLGYEAAKLHRQGDTAGALAIARKLEEMDRRRELTRDEVCDLLDREREGFDAWREQVEEREQGLIELLEDAITRLRDAGDDADDLRDRLDALRGQ